jgi:hypothetical protein
VEEQKRGYVEPTAADGPTQTEFGPLTIQKGAEGESEDANIT